MTHASRPTSTILPTGVGGFLIEDETVSSCTAVKKAASPNSLSLRVASQRVRTVDLQLAVVSD
jgi:hypothetical protein